MNFFGPTYDKNLEVSCVPQNKNGQIKQVGDIVKYIEKEYVQAVPVKVKNDTYQTLGGYPTKTYYILKKHTNKIKSGTISSLEIIHMNSNNVTKNGVAIEDKRYSVIYGLRTQDGKIISGVSSNTGCFHDKIFFIIDGVSTGGLRRRNKRVTKRKRKMSRSSHHKKSRKNRK
jgi:hypothetical protein